MLAGAEIVKKQPVEGTPGRFTFENGTQIRRAMWSGNGALAKAYPTLSFVARRMLSLHATSCAPERNWSHWGRMYRKDRSLLGVRRAEKLIFLSSQAKLSHKQLKSVETLEEEFLCKEVCEALANCVLNIE